MLSVEIDLSQIEGASAAWKTFPARVKKHLKIAMQDSVSEVRQGALDRVHVITGTLRRSITTKVEENAEGGFSGRIGSNLKYARIEEEGFDGYQFVKPHSRSVKSRNVMADVGLFEKRMAVVAAGMTMVHGHARYVTRQGHPYLHPALAEQRATITAYHRRAIVDAADEMDSAPGAA